MKNIVLTIVLIFSTSISAQVAIGKNSLSSDAVSLEFGSANKGIVLPWVTNESAVTGVVNGTLIYDSSDHKIKVKFASGWKDLSVDNTGTADTTLQDDKSDSESAKVSIGTPATSPAVPGILVLEDSNKAMVLPKVASPHLNIQNPAAGMMVYDTSKKQLAVFNGSVWTFWKR